MKDFDYELPRLRKILCIKKIRKIANLSDFLQRYCAISARLEELKENQYQNMLVQFYAKTYIPISPDDSFCRLHHQHFVISVFVGIF